jgi:pre-mRNA-splicing factor SPF27
MPCGLCGLYADLVDVDAPPKDHALAAAKRLVDGELASSDINTTHMHPSIVEATAYTAAFTPAIAAEHARLQTDPSSKLAAIDTSRYEPPDAPSNTTPRSDEERPELLAQWNTALRQAYTQSEYVNSRTTELGLLEKFGKNAWLVGNWQLEEILKEIESELKDVRRQGDEVEAARRAQQESVAGEIRMLEASWAEGTRRLAQTEVAAEGLKMEILDRKRQGAI